MESEIILRILVFFVLMGMSGFFSGSETAIFSLSPVQLVQLDEEGHPLIGLLRAMLDQPRRLIATIFIGNEFVNIGASALMAAMVNQLLSQQGKVVVTLVSTGISVTLILFIGEITAKNLAMRLVRPWSMAAVRPLWLLALVMAPLRFAIEKIADGVVHLVQRRVVDDGNDETVGETEFLTMVDAVEEEGGIDRSERELIHNIFELGDRKVTTVMTPANDVFALNYNLPLRGVLEQVKQSKYSRIPVYQGSRDRIVGVLYAKDLLAVAYGQGAPQVPLKELLHPGYFIPKTVSCDALFREFRRRMTHIALVVNEYGHLVGLVTMEDLLEEVFGEIRDEKEVPHRTGEHDLVELGLAPDPDARPSPLEPELEEPQEKTP